MSAVQIHIENAMRTYGEAEARVHALAGVTLDIRKGDFLAFAGPSGSGKTTMLNLIGCLDSPDSGVIVFDGVDLHRLSNREKTRFRNEKIGFIFQDFNLVPVLTALENVQLALELQGKLNSAAIKRQSLEMLARVGLEKLENRRPSQLSGGQQQRVAIARALVKEPAVLLADEPTANLDSGNAREILELMQSLNASMQTTCIFSTHDPLVMQYARRLVHLRDGHIESATAKEPG